MPLSIKLFFTIASVVIGILVCFLSSGKNSAGLDGMWRTGKNDPFRRLLYRTDGSTRRYMKSGILITFALLLFVFWVLVPTIEVVLR